jgi:hypothetical protein
VAELSIHDVECGCSEVRDSLHEQTFSSKIHLPTTLRRTRENIDDSEIIDTALSRAAPMLPASAGLR